MEILMTPGKVTIVFEAYTQVEHIYTDGRKLPEDPGPSTLRCLDRSLGGQYARR